MSKGRPPDPKRAKRGTGNRPAQGKTKATTDPVALVGQTAAAIVTREPPSTLPAEVHPLWHTYVAEMGGNTHLREADLATLETLCWFEYAFALASGNVMKFKTMVRGPHGPKRNPDLQTMKDAAAMILRYKQELGLTPSARIRLGLMEIAGMTLLSSLNEQLDR